MLPEMVAKARFMNPGAWHQTLRKNFRTRLWQIVGSYEMVIFFIVAPFNNRHLQILRYFSNYVAYQVACREVSEKERNARILELSRKYVRWPTSQL